NSCGGQAFGRGLSRYENRIEEQTVDREVAALHVLFRTEGIAHHIGMAAVGVSAVGTKCGYFGYEACARILGRDQHDAKVCAYREGARKHVEHHVGRSTGGHVVVDRRTAEKKIAHTPAG